MKRGTGQGHGHGQGQGQGAPRLDRIFAGAPARRGRLDFLFDERERRAAPRERASGPPAPHPAAPVAPQPWDAPPAPRFRGDAEVFVAAGIELPPRERVAVALAISLGPVRVLLEVASILFCGAVAAIARLGR